MPSEATWYHAHVSLIRRADAKTAVGAVSYITGEPMHDEETGRYCTRKHPGDVLAYGMIAPELSPPRFVDLSQLERTWNDAQKAEKHPRAHLGQHWNIALSREWTPEQQTIVMKAITQEAVDRYGVMAAWAVHDATDHGDDRNAHGHIVYNLRQITENGFGPKVRRLGQFKSGKEEVAWFRQMVAEQINRHNEMWGLDERVSHLSHADRGIVQEPTKHLGDKQNQMELQGNVTPIGEHNRGVRRRNEQHNAEMAGLKAEHARLTAEIIEIETERQRRGKGAMSDTIDNASRWARSTSSPPVEAELADQPRKLAAAYEEAEREKARLLQRERDRLGEFDQFEKARKAESEHAIRNERKRREDDNALAAENAPADAKNRYAQAMAGYDVNNPYSSLSKAASAEYAAFAKQQDEYRRQEAAETDSSKRRMIQLARVIEAYEYMSITGHRLAAITRVATGNKNNEGAAAAEFYATFAAEQAKDLREERRELTKEIRARDLDQVMGRTRVNRDGVTVGDRGTASPGFGKQAEGASVERNPTAHTRSNGGRGGGMSR